MGLFGMFSKKKSVESKIQSGKTNLTRDRLDRLTPSGDLPFGWVAHNKKFVQRVMDEDARDLKSIDASKEPVKRCEAMRRYILGLEGKKKRYRKMGECEGKYFEYYICEAASVENLKREYTKLKANLKKVQKEYEDHKHVQEVVFPKLRGELLVLIKDNPGILQTEAYKHFAPDEKLHVSGVLSTMASDGEIIRTKSGRTYSLKIGKIKKKARA